MIDKQTAPLDDTQRLKQALSIVAGRMDVLARMIDNLPGLEAPENDELRRLRTYARKSVDKTDQLFERLSSGEVLVP